jgi:bacteriorhodopsin
VLTGPEIVSTTCAVIGIIVSYAAATLVESNYPWIYVALGAIIGVCVSGLVNIHQDNLPARFRR